MRTSDKTIVHEKQRGIDIDAARTYLMGIERLADEGAHSADPRVVELALSVLAHQADAITKLMARPEWRCS